MISGLTTLLPPVPPSSQDAFRRDLPALALRAAILVLCLAVGSQLVQDLGGTRAHVAWLHAAPAAGLLASLAYVRLGRGRSPLKMLFWPEMLSRSALIGVGLLLGLLPTGSHPTAFTALLCICACLGSMPYPFLGAIYGQIYPSRIRGSIIAFGRMVHALVSIGVAFGLGLLLRQSPEAYRLVYPACGLLGIAATVFFCSLSLLPRPDTDSHRPASAWQIVLKDTSFRRFQFFQFLFGFANLCAAPVVAIYIHERLGLSLDLRVLIVGHGVIAQVTLLGTVRLHGRLFDQIGVLRHRVLTSTLVGCGFALWAWADNLGIAIVAATLVGLGLAGGQIIWMIGSLSFGHPTEYATYTGIHTFLTGIRGCLAPLLGVWLLGPTALDGDYHTFFLGTTALVFLSVLGHHFLVPEPHLPGAQNSTENPGGSRRTSEK